MTLAFHVVATKTFSDGFTTYTRAPNSGPDGPASCTEPKQDRITVQESHGLRASSLCHSLSTTHQRVP